MNKFTGLFAISLLLCVIHAKTGAQELFIPGYSGDYFGQEKPGMTPEVFAEKILSRTICSVFTPDGNEMFFCKDFDGNNTGDILVTRRVNNRWTVPEPAEFNTLHTENDMCVSHDGRRIFFRSWRPLPGKDKPEERSYLWYSEKTETGWSKAKLVESEGNYLQTGYPGIARNGSLYFSYRAPGNVGESDLHCSGFQNGKYDRPVTLGASVNTKYIEGDMCIAADESFLVVSCWYRPDHVGGGESDLYVSFRKKDGTWGQLINMGKTINGKLNENCPTLSPDGKYFFFMKYDPENKEANTYWIDSDYIQTLKPGTLR